MPWTNGVGAERRPPSPLPAAAPSLADALIQLVEVAQRVVLDRVDLARFDLAQIATRMLRAAALVAVGAVCLAGAWFALLAGAVVWALDYMPLFSALALAALVSVAAGAAAIAAGVRRAGDPDNLEIPSVRRAASAGVAAAGRTVNASGATS